MSVAEAPGNGSTLTGDPGQVHFYAELLTTLAEQFVHFDDALA